MKLQYTFDELFSDETRRGTKIPASEYKTKGKYPIIDQGKGTIAGYTDEAEGLFTDVPAIIFGDHTRIVKYVDVPFFIGADGVKILSMKKAEDNSKYFYYALKNARIPDTGYNRHFKWLREQRFLRPAIDEQNIIVRRLDAILRLTNNTESQLAKLDALAKARFIEMFGDPLSNPLRLPMTTIGNVCDFEGGSQPPKKEFIFQPQEGYIRLIQIRDYKTDEYITYAPKEKCKRFCTTNDIMIGRYGPPIFQILQGIEGAYNVALMKAIPHGIDKEFMRAYFKREELLHHLEHFQQRTAGQAGIEMSELRAYPCPLPPIKQQKAYVNFVQQVDKAKSVLQKLLEKQELLRAALIQEYFG